MVSSNLQQAYIAVERAYSQRQFAVALERANQLLPAVAVDAPELLGLRLRLLAGHIHLYGLGQPDEALGLYRQVAEASQDATYRDLALQGVQRCEQLATSGGQGPGTPAAEPDRNQAERPPAAATASPAADAGLDTGIDTTAGAPGSSTGAAPAMPWMTELSDKTTDGAPSPGADGPSGQAAPLPMVPSTPPQTGGLARSTAGTMAAAGTAAAAAVTAGAQAASPAPARVDAINSPVPRAEAVEVELVDGVADAPAAVGAPGRQPDPGVTRPNDDVTLAFSPAEAAELAKGLLRVSLG